MCERGAGISSWVAASVAAAAGGMTGVKPSLFETGLTPLLRCGLCVWGPRIFWPFPHVRLRGARDFWPTAETSDVPPPLRVSTSHVLQQKSLVSCGGNIHLHVEWFKIVVFCFFFIYFKLLFVWVPSFWCKPGPNTNLVHRTSIDW